MFCKVFIISVLEIIGEYKMKKIYQTSFQQDTKKYYNDLSNTENRINKSLRSMHRLAFGFTAKGSTFGLVGCFLLMAFGEPDMAKYVFVLVAAFAICSQLFIRKKYQS